MRIKGDGTREEKMRSKEQQTDGEMINLLLAFSSIMKPWFNVDVLVDSRYYQYIA